jgi:phosphate transport system substrate-binding protein
VNRRIRTAGAAAALVPVALLAAACSSSSSSSSSSSAASSSSATNSATAAATASASASPSIPAAPSSGTLTETGSSVMFPLVSEWQKGYTAQYPGIKISTASTNSGTGVSSAGGGLVNLGTSDSSLSASQTSEYPTLENIPMGVDAIDIAYNVKGLTAPLNLNGTVLAQIYDGKITNWNDSAIAALNPGVTLPNERIVTVHRADSSGSTVLFAQYLNAQDPTDWPSTLISSTPTWPKVAGSLAETGSGAMVTGAQSAAGSIAYIGISYGSKITAAKLSVAALENGASKYVTPDNASLTAAVDSFPAAPADGTENLINTTAAAGYAISGYEYTDVNTTQSSATQAGLIQNFLYWALTTGSSSSYLGKVGFVPLPKATFDVAVNLITKISSS